MEWSYKQVQAFFFLFSLKQLSFTVHGVPDSQFGISWLTMHVKLRKAGFNKCFVMTKILAHYFCFRHDEKVLKQKDKKKPLLRKGPIFTSFVSLNRRKMTFWKHYVKIHKALPFFVALSFKISS